MLTARRIIYSAIGLLLLAVNTHAQVVQKYFGRTGRSHALQKQAVLNNGNEVVVGHTWTGTAQNVSDAFIMCLDAADNVVWAKEIATPNNDRFLSVTATSDGGCVAVGYAGQATGSIYNGNHAIIYKFDAAGNVLWNKILNNTSAGEVFTDVIEIPGSGHIVCTGFYDWGGTLVAGLVVNLDNAGNILWNRVYDEPGSAEFRLATYMDGRLIITGNVHGSTYYDLFLLALNESNGNILWAKTYDFSSTLGGAQSCQWPHQLYRVQNKLYADVYTTQNYGLSTSVPTLMSFDTNGLNPVCLEYPLMGYSYSGFMSSTVVAPDEIYLTLAMSNTEIWNPWMGRTVTGIADVVCQKIKSMNAANPGLVYARYLNTSGAQGFSYLRIANGQMTAYGIAKPPTAMGIGNEDGFKLVADTGFQMTIRNCVANVAGQRFGNPQVTVTNKTFTATTPTFPNPALAPTVTAVNMSSMNPCPSNDTVILNDYAAVLARDTCENALIVDTGTAFNAGDVVLVIQMKGARIDSSNGAGFGNLTDLGNAGKYEMNVVRARTGNSISLEYTLVNNYDIPNGLVQLVRVPTYQNYTVSQPHTCMPWNGTKGGVFAINVTGTMTLSQDINVSGCGFRGGAASANYYSGCSSMDYFYPSGSGFSGGKGEGITALISAYASGRGAQANGGGGGNHVNSGGGGGGNYGPGGRGGDQWNGCPIVPIGGEGGKNLVYNNTQNRIFLGGGGGGGHQNDNGTPPGEKGGGIVLIQAGTLSNNNRAIRANGMDQLTNGVSDGGSGGGAGGSILLSVSTLTGTGTVEAKGGSGGGITHPTCHGPGGGGGGGVVWTNATIPGGWTTNVSGGTAGFAQCGSVYGAAAGGAGSTLSGLSIPRSSVRFISVAAPGPASNSPVCPGDSIRLWATNNLPGSVSHNWSGPGGFSSNQREPVIPNATPTRSGVYTLTTSYLGCTASDTVHVLVADPPVVDLGADTGLCVSQLPITLRSPQPTGTHYLWSNGLSDSTMTVDRSGSFWLQVTTPAGCTGSDTIHIQATPDPVIFIGNDTIICEQTPARIGTELPGAQYVWSNGETTPYIEVSTTGNYTLTVNIDGCRASDTVAITAMPAPDFDAGGDRFICPHETLTLSANYSGAGTYLWSTGATTSDISITEPGTYWVKVTSEYRCFASDTLIVTRKQLPLVYAGRDTTVCVDGSVPLLLNAWQEHADSLLWSNGHIGQQQYITQPGDYTVTAVNQCGEALDTIVIGAIFCDIWVPNAFTPNGDGSNDRFRVLGSIGRLQNYSFSIFSRWGQRLFTTTDRTEGWDGTLNGIPQPLGTYVYLLEYTLDGKPYVQKGNFHLMR